MQERIPLLHLWLWLVNGLMVPSGWPFRSESPKCCQPSAPATVRIMAALWNNHDFVRDKHKHKHLGLHLSSQVSCIEQYINSEGDKSACVVILHGDKNSPSVLLSCAICLWDGSWLCISLFLLYVFFLNDSGMILRGIRRRRIISLHSLICTSGLPTWYSNDVLTVLMIESPVMVWWWWWWWLQQWWSWWCSRWWWWWWWQSEMSVLGFVGSQL